MATTLLHKKSSTAGSAPGTSDLTLGEIAVNTSQGYLFTKVDDGVTTSIYRFRGEPLTDTAISIDTFTGDGSTTDFSLSRIPEADRFLFVTINGVQQHVDAYSISNTTLTFSEAPDNGDDIEARIFSIISSSVQVRDYYTYVYTISGDTTSISGADDNGDTLAYDLDKVEVYYNGARLVIGSDFTATDGSTITLQSTVTTGDTIEVVSLSKASFVDNTALKPYSSTLAGTTAQLVDKFDLNNYRTAKYLVQMTQGSDYHVSEVLLMHDGTDVYITEYGTMYTTNSLGTISADINNSYVRLLVTPASATSMVVKGQRIQVTV